MPILPLQAVATHVTYYISQYITIVSINSAWEIHGAGCDDKVLLISVDCTQAEYNWPRLGHSPNGKPKCITAS